MKEKLYVNGFAPEFAPVRGPVKREKRGARGVSPLLMRMIANPAGQMLENLCTGFERFVNSQRRTMRRGPGQSRSESHFLNSP